MVKRKIKSFLGLIPSQPLQPEFKYPQVVTIPLKEIKGGVLHREDGWSGTITIDLINIIPLGSIIRRYFQHQRFNVTTNLEISLAMGGTDFFKFYRALSSVNFTVDIDNIFIPFNSLRDRLVITQDSGVGVVSTNTSINIIYEIPKTEFQATK